MYPPSIQKLINFFSEFPGVGPRTATRFVFYLLKKEKSKVKELALAILDLKKKIKFCEFCFKPFEARENSPQTLCEICSNPLREKKLLCIVANEIDLEAIEKTKKYKGRYFILGGTIPALKKADFEKLRIKELEKRLKENPEIEEIILAFNPNTEGEATTLYLERILKPYNKKITKLARGLPVGGEIEYADEETLSFAILKRD
jgi:recombination protein RecR